MTIVEPALHRYVDPREDRQPRGVGFVRRDPVRDQFAIRVIVRYATAAAARDLCGAIRFPPCFVRVDPRRGFALRVPRRLARIGDAERWPCTERDARLLAAAGANLHAPLSAPLADADEQSRLAFVVQDNTLPLPNLDDLRVDGCLGEGGSHSMDSPMGSRSELFPGNAGYRIVHYPRWGLMIRQHDLTCYTYFEVEPKRVYWCLVESGA